MSIAPGTRVGPCEVVSAIGSGGMGEVFKARDTQLQRDVALKVLPPMFARNADRQARFEREAQAIAALSHPNIVGVFDTGLHDGQLYVVMELLDGESLRTRLTEGALPARKAIDVAVQIARGLAAAHRVSLGAPGLCTRINTAQLEQVVTNLVVNARDAMPGGGLVMIQTAEVTVDAQQVAGLAAGRYVRVRGSDTDPGIPADVRPHIFEPFFTTKSTDLARGVGLATAHGIVTQCGGTFDVDSRPGHGATFTFYLPVTDAAADAQTTETPSADGRETVLVVEDDNDVRMLVSEMLRAKGYAVLDAPGPDAALQIVRTHAGTLHVLLTDVVMPGMSGVELAKHVRLLPNRSRWTCWRRKCGRCWTGRSLRPALSSPACHVAGGHVATF